MFICNECGRVTESSEADFCYHCGSSNGTMGSQNIVPEGFQPVMANGGGVIYADRSKLRRVPLALLLAFVPGLFDIFGLGHFVIGRWVRGSMFLASSAVYYYLRYMSGWDMLAPYLTIFSLALFVIQMVDLYNGFKKVLNESIL